MDHKTNSTRTTFSFALSFFIHTLIFASGALIGAFFTQHNLMPKTAQKVETAKGEQTYSITTATPAAAAPTADAEPVIAPNPTPAPPQEPPVVATQAPKAKPVAKASTSRTEKSQKTIVVTDFSKESAAAQEQVTPQDVVEVNESLNEPDTYQVVKSTDEEVSKEAEAAATPDVVAPAAATAAEEVAKEEAAAQAVPTEATPAEVTQAASPAQAQEASQPQQAPQNFVSLKQAPGNQPPSYPEAQRLQQVQGKGQLKYYVAKDGSVTDVAVTQSTGSKELDQAALDAFSKYKFVPGQEGYTVHNFEFTLQGPTETAPKRLRTATAN